MFEQHDGRSYSFANVYAVSPKAAVRLRKLIARHEYNRGRKVCELTAVDQLIEALNVVKPALLALFGVDATDINDLRRKLEERRGWYLTDRTEFVYDLDVDYNISIGGVELF